MVVRFIYSDNDQRSLGWEVEGFCRNNKLYYMGLDRNYYKDKKKAINTMVSCGAYTTPFCSIYDNNKELIKCFYSESKECTVDNIINYLKGVI